MKKILLAGALSAALAAPALAASVTDGHLRLLSGDGVVLIEINGTIIEGDADSFGRLEEYTKGPIVVMFNSPGGALIEGLAIGEKIKNHKDITVAYGTCGSACAYAWLAGSKRAMASGAQVVFHSPFQKNDEGHADGTAGVMVGQYLAEIGIDLKTSMAITGHGPDDYYVLSSAAKNPMVTFSVIDGVDSQVGRSVAAAPVSPPQQVHQNINIGMTCRPVGGFPYYVAYDDDAKTINVTGSVNGKKPVVRPYPVFEVNNDQRKHVVYVAAKRGDQTRTLYSAFDYSRNGHDASATRVKSPNYDASDKCEFNQTGGAH